jgi:hypothetical protein
VTAKSRRTDLVLRVFKDLVADGVDGVSPGAICGRLRDISQPLGTWEVRGELTTLEAGGEIVLDEDRAVWYLNDKRRKRQQLRDSA